MIRKYEGEKKLFRFSDFINESKEDKQVHPRPLNIIEKYHVKMLVDFLEIVYEYTGGDNGYKERTEKEYNEFKDKIQAFKKLPFAKHVLDKIENTDRAFKERDEAMKGLAQTEKVAFDAADRMRAFLEKGDIESAYKLNDHLQKSLQLISKARTVSVHHTAFQNTYRKQSSIFGQDDFLPDFGEGDLKKLSEIDYSKEMYTYLNFPQKKLDDFKYLAYFALNLRHDVKPVRLSGDEFRRWHEMLHVGDPKYNGLIEKVQDYLYSNKKESIPEILEEMKRFPELAQANEKRKREIKKVFRGIGFHMEEDAEEYNSNEILQREKENKYVATSTSKWAAQNFELMKGHLESGRNSDYGFMIEYDLTPEAVVLDTSIFGGAFGGVESEVLIDATKAKVASIKKSHKHYGKEAA